MYEYAFVCTYFYIILCWCYTAVAAAAVLLLTAAGAVRHGVPHDENLAVVVDCD